MERRRLIIISEDVLCNKSLSLAEKCVYARIAGFEEYFESAEECADLLGLGLSTVRSAKQKLEKLGYIECVRNTGRGKAYRAVLDYRKGDNVASDTVNESNPQKVTQKAEPDSKPSYGNSSINSMFDYWQKCVGTPIISREKSNRRACYNLLRNKHIGEEKLRHAVEFLGEIKEDRFAPRISDFVDLQSKFNALCDYKNRRDQQTPTADANDARQDDYEAEQRRWVEAEKNRADDEFVQKMYAETMNKLKGAKR